ncbi:MAG TPA: hypothetical protein VFW25_10510 [Silvibacterium sp.]|nr:hypothetical protein [Silvibacterium sp.]
MPKSLIRASLVVLALWAAVAFAQQPPLNSPLLDHMVGNWVLTGNTEGTPTSHDVEAEWVLGHHYLRIHEISRVKNARGEPDYEASVYVAWNEPLKQYACAWLDVFGGLSAQSIGVATLEENKIPFIFHDPKGVLNFENDFIYDPKTDTWQWVLDGVTNGVHKPFARYQLKRASKT